MPTDARPTLSPGRAVGLFFAYLFVFALGGGLGAGLPALVFELVAGRSYEDPMLYAISFGVMGFIAYRLASRVLE